MENDNRPEWLTEERLARMREVTSSLIDRIVQLKMEAHGLTDTKDESLRKCRSGGAEGTENSQPTRR